MQGGSTALRIAAGVGEVGMVELLLLKGAVLETQDGTERRGVHVAAQAGHVGVTAALLAAGADVGARYGAYSLSTLEVVARNGRAGVVQMLIERGVNMNTTGMEGSTPVHQAAHGGSAPAIDMLAKAEANIDKRNVKGATPIHLAAMQCYLEVAPALLRHGAEVNTATTQILTPLHLAAGFAGSERAAEMVDLLLRWGADESVTDEEGRKAGDFVWVDACCGWIAQGVQDTQPAESEQRVRPLLANAPADRTWRRRGLLIMGRAHRGRVATAGVTAWVMTVGIEDVFQGIVSYL